jgi:hypothetical protein
MSENLEQELYAKERDRQYHMDAINRLASFLAFHGTSFEVVQAAMDNISRMKSELAAADKARDDADHFFVLSGKYLERANDAEAQRDKALVALNAIKEYWEEDITNRAMFDACWFAKNTAEEVLKECWKPKVEK